MKNDRVHIRISERDKEKLQELAEDQQMSMSELIVFLIRKEYENQKVNNCHSSVTVWSENP